MSAPDAGVLLARALERSADAAGLALAVTRSATTRWASATFTGARHELDVTLSPEWGALAWLARLPDAELAVRGHLVADLKLVRSHRADGPIMVVLEALTVEDR